MHVNSDMTVKEILSSYPFLMAIFRNHGLGKFEDKEVLEKLGSMLKLKTALNAKELNSEIFVDMLNTSIEENSKLQSFSITSNPERQRELTLLALLPCGMKMPFTRTLEKFIADYNKAGNSPIHFLTEGNVNHEISYHEYIDSITDPDELPDVIVSSDINSFYHKSFLEKFAEKGVFVDVTSGPMNCVYEGLDYRDPKGYFTMLSSNLLVLVVIEELMGDLKIPEKWEDLLKEEYRDTLVMRGDGRFFCNGVLLPFYKMFGLEGVKKLSNSVCLGLHPAEMVKMIDSRKSDVPPMYVMPLFFSENIKHRDRIKIIAPEEGAIISPVQMLVKKEAAERVKPLTDFLTGEVMGETCANAFFPTTNAGVENYMKGIEKLMWLDWDFLYSDDVGKMKNEIAEVFMEKFK